MSKRPSLFAVKNVEAEQVDIKPIAEAPAEVTKPAATRPPSRVGKRVLSIYLDPLAWMQLRQLVLDIDTSTQVLGEEAVNLLFAKHGLNRSA